MRYYILFELFLGCILFNNAHGSFAEHREDYKCIPGTNSLYKLHKTKTTWYDAKATCEREGTTLFYPENESEANTVMTFWQKTEPEEYSYWIFVGMKRSGDSFETLNGTSISRVFNNWLAGEPNSQGGDENCVELFREVVPHIKWLLNDVPCTNRFTFICKAQETEQCDVPKHEGQVLSDYKLIPGTNRLYKLHKTKAMWHDAKATCEREGTTLFYPENESEANTVMTFWQKTEPEEYSYWTFVGMTRSGGTFETINGTDISNVFHNWLAGEPNNAGGDENCVELFREVVPHIKWLINDAPCTLKFTFICKAPEIQPSQEQDSKSEHPNQGVYIPGTRGYYKLHKTKANWNSAKEVCESEGSSLFYPENESEAFTVMSYWQKPYSESLNNIQVGMKRMGESFESTNGTSISNVFNIWQVGEPNNDGGDENCVELFKGTILHNVHMFKSVYQNVTYEKWYIKDVSCDRELSYVCKTPITEWNELCDMPNLDYTFAKETGQCYKHHVVPLTWSEARNVCRAENSDLAMINSLEEASYLVELTKKVPRVGIRGTIMNADIFLGLQRITIEGREAAWTAVASTPLKDSGYECWGENQPDFEDRDKCGSMMDNGLLNNIGCEEKALFICEHNTPNFIKKPLLTTSQCHAISS